MNVGGVVVKIRRTQRCSTHVRSRAASRPRRASSKRSLREAADVVFSLIGSAVVPGRGFRATVDVVFEGPPDEAVAVGGSVLFMEIQARLLSPHIWLCEARF